MEVIRRRLKDLKPVLWDKAWAKTSPDFEVYSVRRGVRSKKGLRYDETVMPYRKLGSEFPKTFGHEHPKDCLELMEVVRGQALFLLQRDEGKIVIDAYFIKAKKGQAVVSPFGYSHVTINPGPQELKIGTWLPENCSSSYQTIKSRRGAGYFYTSRGWQKNKNYRKVAKLREEKPLKKVPPDLDFLKCSCC